MRRISDGETDWSTELWLETEWVEVETGVGVDGTVG